MEMAVANTDCNALLTWHMLYLTSTGTPYRRFPIYDSQPFFILNTHYSEGYDEPTEDSMSVKVHLTSRAQTQKQIMPREIKKKHQEKA